MGGGYVLSTYCACSLRGGNDFTPVIMAFPAQIWESMDEIFWSAAREAPMLPRTERTPARTRRVPGHAERRG
jgi:hypothetical protein